MIQVLPNVWVKRTHIQSIFLSPHGFSVRVHHEHGMQPWSTHEFDSRREARLWVIGLSIWMAPVRWLWRWYTFITTKHIKRDERREAMEKLAMTGNIIDCALAIETLLEPEDL